MVLGFTYSTVIHFELVLAYGVTSGLIGPLLLKKYIDTQYPVVTILLIAKYSFSLSPLN